MERLEDKVEKIKKFNDNFMLVTFNNGFKVAYENQIEPQNVRYKLLLIDFLNETYLRHAKTKDINTHEPPIMKEVTKDDFWRGYDDFSEQNFELLTDYCFKNGTYVENFNKTAGNFLEKLAEDLILKKVTSRDWKQLKQNYIHGMWHYLIQEGIGKNITNISSFSKNMIKEIIFPQEFLKSFWKFDETKIYKENRGKDPAIIFKKDNMDLILDDETKMKQVKPNKCSSLEIIFPNGIDLNFFGISNLEKMSKYNNSKYFIRPKQELIDQVYALNNRKQEALKQWNNFEQELKKVDHETFLKYLDFI